MSKQFTVTLAVILIGVLGTKASIDRDTCQLQKVIQPGQEKLAEAAKKAGIETFEPAKLEGWLFRDWLLCLP
jgi:hypothetical protein